MKLSRLLIVALLALAFANLTLADECDPNDPSLLKPDLVTEKPSRVRVLRHLGHRVVIFSTTIGNVGKGPLVLHGQTVTDITGKQVTQANQEIRRADGTSCTHFAGFFQFHPTHHHWHFGDFSDYQLRKDDPFTGPIVAQSAKVSFCLINVQQLRGFSGPITIASNCLDQNGIQGIDA